MKANIGLMRIDGHKSHVSGRRSVRFLNKIGFHEYQAEKLKDWFEKYKNGNNRRT